MIFPKRSIHAPHAGKRVLLSIRIIRKLTNLSAAGSAGFHLFSSNTKRTGNYGKKAGKKMVQNPFLNCRYPRG